MTATHGAWIDGGKINVATVRITDGLHTTPTDPDHTIVDRRGLFVIHAVMLHTKKVLWFCGHVEDGHYALKSYLFDYRHPSAQLASQDFPFHSSSLTRTGPGLGNANDPASGHFHADLFCCHFVHTADGKVLVVGGSDPDYRAPGGTNHGSVGERYIYLFDPTTESWSTTRPAASHLAEGRWYPTAVMLGDGRIAVVSGRKAFAELAGTTIPSGTLPRDIGRLTVAQTVELLKPGATPGSFTVIPLTSGSIALPLYPGLHLAPNGRIYYTHTTWGLEFEPPANTQSLEIPNGSTTASWTNHTGVAPSQPRREEGMSVLLPLLLPDRRGKILLFGGSSAVKADGTTPYLQRLALADAYGNTTVAGISSTADPKHSEVLDTSGAAPAWSAGPSLLQPRINGHGVILPDKKVLIFGGHDKFKWWGTARSCTASLPSELYDPATNTTAPMANLNHPRRYHAAAVLLPDGSVLVAGGADPDATEMGQHSGPPDSFAYPGGWAGPGFGTTMAYNRKDYEIFRPTYFFTAGTRPTITSIKKTNGAVTTRAAYGENIVVSSAEAASITDVALIRPGAATHHTDSEQRYVALAFSRNGTALTVAIPSERNLCPPGYYMLWIVAAGKPCEEAEFILIGDVWRPPPPATPAPPEERWCVVVTAATGSRSAPEVLFLQDLRRALAQSSQVGAWFVRAINAIYYTGSPALAGQMHRRRGLRSAVRMLLVTPSVDLIRYAKRTAGYAGGRPGSIRLMAVLVVLGLVGIALLPMMAVLVGLRWGASVLRNEVEVHDE
jgi:hypothetical protein